MKPLAPNGVLPRRVMRAVADTNIVVSAILWGGPPGQILTAARTGRLSLFTSAALIAELEDVIARKRFAERLTRVELSVAQIVDGYLALVQLVRAPAIAPAGRDRDDDHVIACALAANAAIIVSGDHDLLVLGAFRDIGIKTASEALAILAEADADPRPPRPSQ